MALNLMRASQRAFSLKVNTLFRHDFPAEHEQSVSIMFDILSVRSLPGLSRPEAGPNGATFFLRNKTQRPLRRSCLLVLGASGGWIIYTSTSVSL